MYKADVQGARMRGTILFESLNLTLPTGTGIATYAQSLSKAARAAGYGTEALITTRQGSNRSAPVLDEIGLYDAVASEAPGRVGLAARYVSRLLSAPFGLSMRDIPQTGLVINPTGGPGAFASFDRIRAVRHLFETAQAWFAVSGQFLELRRDTPPALFHATHPTPLRVKGAPHVVTIHDLVPLKLPSMSLERKRFHYRLIKRLIERADHIVTVSEHSKRDIVSFFKADERRITNLYQTVEFPEALLAKTDDEVAGELEGLFGLEFGGYYLHVGAIEPKKNVAGLVDAYAASRVKRPLVLAGKLGWSYDRDVARIDDERFAGLVWEDRHLRKDRQVRRLDYVKRDHLVSLMRGARALLFPSIYEGFGLPVLEAMVLGTPVMTSTTSSLPEVAGDAALLVDPTETAAMARAIRTLDSDDALCADLAARGKVQAQRFAPDAYREAIAGFYRTLLDGR